MNVKQKSTFRLFAGKLRTISVIILLVFTFSVCHAQTNSKPTGNKSTVKKQVAKEEVFEIVEEFPEFPGGDEALKTFVADNLKYPNAEREFNIQGSVYVRFFINSSGDVKKASVYYRNPQKIVPNFDKEALRIVSLLPKFKPGKQNGKAVSVWYPAVRVRFELP